jgi:hypothetical protein
MIEGVCVCRQSRTCLRLEGKKDRRAAGMPLPCFEGKAIVHHAGAKSLARSGAKRRHKPRTHIRGARMGLSLSAIYRTLALAAFLFGQARLSVDRAKHEPKRHFSSAAL